MPVLGFWDLLIIGFLVLLVFGPKRLPQMGKSMGGAIRGFKDAITGHVAKQDAEAEAEEKQLQAEQAPKSLPPAQTQPAADPREHDTVV